jgi:hypothetical protein
MADRYGNVPGSTLFDVSVAGRAPLIVPRGRSLTDEGVPHPVWSCVPSGEAPVRACNKHRWHIPRGRLDQ